MLFIQDPYSSQLYTLHEELIKTCTISASGNGAYAFASASGVELLCNDDEFKSLLDRGTYSMVIGIDSITNMACIEELNKMQSNHRSLNVKAFLHGYKALFHPKISYFKNKGNEGGTLIIGSGNLTMGGLRNNIEAFSKIELSKEEFERIDSFWKAWITASQNLLKNLDDPKVITKARENSVISRKEKQLTSFITSEEIANEVSTESTQYSIIEDGWEFYKSNSVLLAEIPKSHDRWKQANFDIETFKHFFGATPGDKSQRILLRNIKDENSLGKLEARPSVSVKSHNYRFELDAATGLAYPTEGKPIGIFVKLTTRMFLYHLFMPNDDVYKELEAWMSSKWHGKGDRMKRIQTTVTEIENILSKTLFNKYLQNENTRKFI